MKILFQKYKYPIYLILIASIWILFVTFGMQLFQQNFIFGDTKSYILAAQELFLKHKLNSQRPLIISFINGFPLLFGFSKSVLFFWSLSINLFCWFAIILVVFLICEERANSKLAFQVALIFVFCIGNLFIAFHLLSETIFTFLLIFVFYLTHKYFKKRKNIFLLISIFILILMIMIKPLAFGLFFILMFFVYKQWREVFFNSFSFLIYGSLLLLFFQMNGLKKQYGNFTVSYIDSFTYYNYLGTRADCLKNNLEFKQGLNFRYIYFSTLTDSVQKKIASEDFKFQLKNNKINLFKAYFINLFINSSKGSASVFGCENKDKTICFEGLKLFFKIISKIQNCIFSIIAILLSVYYLIIKRSELIIKIISLSIIYIIAISAISSDQGDRFHIVTYPLILILVAKFIQDNSKPISEPPQK